MIPVAMEQVRLADQFWGRWTETVRTKLIPYQWEALNDRVEGAAPSHCIRNFRIAAGLEAGEFGGKVFQDSDVAKWLEAVAYSLLQCPDPELERTADAAIDLIVSAQQPDGYLDTYYIINGLDQRFTNLRDQHELYCAGHMIEAAVAYYRATGKRKLLDAMIRYADLLCRVFGPGEEQLHGYPGHEEIELALMKLYDITRDERYMQLAAFFINERGRQPLYFEQETHDVTRKWLNFHMRYQYNQSHLPVREQTEAVGHAVRAMYLYAGMADVARQRQDTELYTALKTIWKNLTRRRMYITGSIGSSHYGEAFTFDYDLPNDTVYGETCAAIGLVFFAKRMLMLEPLGEYGDVMERALYNGVISGMNLEGNRFFYVNPLEVVPEACEKDEEKHHVKPQRQKWFGTACCPPNLARLIGSLPDYIYGTDAKERIYVHLYIGSQVEVSLGERKIRLALQTELPWDEMTTIQVETEEPTEFEIALRLPGWCEQYTLWINAEEQAAEWRDGYLYLRRCWRTGDRVQIRLAMPVVVVQANPRVREDIGKAALMRGPIVYCLEEADNGKDLHRIRMRADVEYQIEHCLDLLQGVTRIRAQGEILLPWEEDSLYAGSYTARYEAKELTWIPYYAWANRETGEMRVFARVRP